MASQFIFFLLREDPGAIDVQTAATLFAGDYWAASSSQAFIVFAAMIRILPGKIRFLSHPDNWRRTRFRQAFMLSGTM